MNMIKVKVTDKFFQLKAGIVVGLDTRWAGRLNGFIESQGQRTYKITKDVKMPKDAVFWLNAKEPPAGTEPIDMPRGYLEPDPLEAKDTAAVIEKLKRPKKNKRWQNPDDRRDREKDAA